MELCQKFEFNYDNPEKLRVEFGAACIDGAKIDVLLDYKGNNIQLSDYTIKR